MQVRHVSNITKERVLLLYSIVTEKSIDLVNFLSSHILQCGKHSSMSLFYPSLITALGATSWVQYGLNEEFLAPMLAITNNKVQTMKGNDRVGAIEKGSQPR